MVASHEKLLAEALFGLIAEVQGQLEADDRLLRKFNLATIEAGLCAIEEAGLVEHVERLRLGAH